MTSQRESDRIRRVRAATIRHALEVPIRFASWVIRHREFAVVRIDADSGVSGFAYCLTRNGPLAEIVKRTIAPAYVNETFKSPEHLFHGALRANHAVHSAGIGMRALSLVDIATWDLAARAAGQSISDYLGGKRHRMPVTGIVGYPPTLGPEETAEQVEALWSKGWRRFKLPVASTPQATLDRLRAARSSAPDGWIGLDANGVFRTAVEAIEFGRQLAALDIGWFEDVVPPGDAEMVREIRKGISTPIAMGDEQGGSYHPQALLKYGAVDVVRVDATTNGGITRLRPIINDIVRAGRSFSPHMFPHVHSQVLSAWGHTDVPIEWGIPGTGVHTMDDTLAQPIVENGLMEPLPESPGFGNLLDPKWISQQSLEDPEEVFADL